MKKTVNLLLGYGEFRVSGADPQRFINSCAGSGVRFWRVKRTDRDSVVFRAFQREEPRLRELAERCGCLLEEVRRFGAARVRRSLRRRWGFAAGLALCAVAAGLLSRFVLAVEVRGNERVSSAAILWELERLGVRPGMWGPSADTKELCNEMLLAMPELAYVTVRVRGMRAEVRVEEKLLPPPLLEEEIPADVVADADGIIEDIHPAAGRAMFADGDIVAKGEVLIAGRMKLRQPQYGDTDTGWLLVRAAGQVYARTWRTLEETLPLNTAVKEYTGAEKKGYTLHFLWGQADFLQNSSIPWEKYDRIADTEFLTLFGRTLPVGVTTVTLREYVLREQPLDVDGAATRLELILRERLAELMKAREGTVLRADAVCRVEGGRLTVTLLAECREQIGRTVELPGEAGFIPGNDPASPAG